MTISNHENMTGTDLDTDKIIHWIMPIHPRKFIIRKLSMLWSFLEILMTNSLLVVAYISTNMFEGNFVHKHIDTYCSTVDCHVSMNVTDKIQEHSNHISIVEITRECSPFTCLAKGFPSAIVHFIFAVLTFNILTKSFQKMFDDAILYHLV